MTLVLTFVCLSIAVAALLWAMCLFVQPYLHGEPVGQLPLRALVGGLAVGCFVTLWVYANTRAERKDKYGTFFEFNPVGTKPVDAFDAVRIGAAAGPDGKHPETTVSFKRPAGKADGFVEAKNPAVPFRLNSTAMMTVAVIVDENGQKVRFDAELTDSGTEYRTPAKVFREAGGSRFIEAGNEGAGVGVIYAPSTGAVVVAILLNVLLFAVWFAVFWPLLQYSSGMALGLAAGFGLATMLVAMPLLFELNAKAVSSVG